MLLNRGANKKLLSKSIKSSRPRLRLPLVWYKTYNYVQTLSKIKLELTPIERFQPVATTTIIPMPAIMKEFSWLYAHAWSKTIFCDELILDVICVLICAVQGIMLAIQYSPFLKPAYAWNNMARYLFIAVNRGVLDDGIYIRYSITPCSTLISALYHLVFPEVLDGRMYTAAQNSVMLAGDILSAIRLCTWSRTSSTILATCWWSF